MKVGGLSQVTKVEIRLKKARRFDGIIYVNPSTRSISFFPLFLSFLSWLRTSSSFVGLSRQFGLKITGEKENNPTHPTPFESLDY